MYRASSSLIRRAITSRTTSSYRTTTTTSKTLSSLERCFGSTTTTVWNRQANNSSNTNNTIAFVPRISTSKQHLGNGYGTTMTIPAISGTSSNRHFSSSSTPSPPITPPPSSSTKQLQKNQTQQQKQQTPKNESKPITRAEAKLRALAHAKQQQHSSSSPSSYNELSRAYSQAIQYVAKTRSTDSATQATHLLYEYLHTTTAQKKKKKSECESPVDDGGGRNFFFFFPTWKDVKAVLESWAVSKVKQKGRKAKDVLVRMLEVDEKEEEEKGREGRERLVGSRAFVLVVRCFAGSTYKDSFRNIVDLLELHDRLALQQPATSSTGTTSPTSFNTFDRNDPFLLLHAVKAVKNYGDKTETKYLDEWLNRLHSVAMAKDDDVSAAATDHNGESSSDEGNGVGEKEGTTIPQIDLTSTYTSVLRECAKRNDLERASLIFQRMHELANHNADVMKRTGLRPRISIDIRTNAYDLMLGLYRDCSKDGRCIDKAIKLLQKMIDSCNRQRQDINDVSDRGTDFRIPIPTDRSFTSTISSLSLHSDMDDAIALSSRLLSDYETLSSSSSVSTISLPRTTEPYDAVFSLYVRLAAIEAKSGANLSSSGVGGGKVSALNLCLSTIERMRSVGMAPGVETWAGILKVCAALTTRRRKSSRMVEKEEILEEAMQLFLDVVPDAKVSPFLVDEMIGAETASDWEMAADGDNDNNAVVGKSRNGKFRVVTGEEVEPNERIYFYTMKCVANSVVDEDEKERRLVDLFTDACRIGVVNGNVLSIFRTHVSPSTFTKTVGNGRLVDDWVVNATSVQVRYVDGSKGGDGKNARRKGKSTSGWAKKKKERLELVRVRKMEKEERKRRKKKVIGEI